MKIKPSDRPGLVRAFRAAKLHLSPSRFKGNDKSEFICWAINGARRAGEISAEERDLAKRVIESRLGDYIELVSWLLAPSSPVRGLVLDDRYSGGYKLQLHRQAWLDLLIAEFSDPVGVSA